jgi:hypothetical protein
LRTQQHTALSLPSMHLEMETLETHSPWTCWSPAGFNDKTQSMEMRWYRLCTWACITSTYASCCILVLQVGIIITTNGQSSNLGVPAVSDSM